MRGKKVLHNEVYNFYFGYQLAIRAGTIVPNEFWLKILWFL